MNVTRPLPHIPRAFMARPKINQALRLTVEHFSYEDQSIIYLYCLVNLNLTDISALTQRPMGHVKRTLSAYLGELNFKLGLFKKAIPYDPDDPADLLDVGGLLSYEVDHPA